jgi:hypothetical protein
MTSFALTKIPSRAIPLRGSFSLRTLFFSLTWILIILAASYDAYFAWQYRAVLDAWEMNPFILWLAGVGGLASVFLVKPFTMVVAGVYFLLSFHYLISNLQG